MINYLKQNFWFIVITLILLFGVFWGDGKLFGASELTTITNPWTFTEDVTLSGTGTNFTITATSTYGSSGTTYYEVKSGIDIAYTQLSLTGPEGTK